MKEFTLSTALNTIGRHLIVSVAIFFVVFLTLPNLSLIDDKHKLVKIVKLGTAPPLYASEMLNYKTANEILGSTSFKLFLSNELKDTGGASHFKLELNELGIFSIELKDDSADVVLNTATAIMKELNRVDTVMILKIFEKLDKDIKHVRNIAQILTDSSDEYNLTPNLITKYAEMQKIYDIKMEVEDTLKNVSSITDLVRLTREVADQEISAKQIKAESEKTISDMQFFKAEKFKPISFLFPVNQSQLENYFPNTFLFFGISLSLALLYNLILLNFKFRKSAQ